MIAPELPDSGKHLQEQIAQHGSWFHNMNVGGYMTAPDHVLGDFPAVKWRHIQESLSTDLRGKSVLDVGCNAGFYAQQAALRGASRVLGIDANPGYLKQARFAAKVNRLEIEFKQMSVYQLDQLDEKFDLVFFLGVFYHLRYPLFALDRVVEKVNGQLLFQSLLRPRTNVESHYRVPSDIPFGDTDFVINQEFPRMHFIENKFGGDPTNWWLPNASCVEAVLRTAGLRIVGRPEDETWLCELDQNQPSGSSLQQDELRGARS